ncbi:MAG TPA: hypothetical protein VGG33_00705 [Polyangia bacterium]
MRSTQLETSGRETQRLQRRFGATGLSVVLVGILGVGCAHQRLVGGTSVPDTEENRQVLETIEQYRQRLVEKNVEGLLLLASERYFEDSGTPSAVDDYGYDGLKFVLANRLTRLRSIRYDIQYRSAKVDQGRAEVECFLSGAFEIIGESRESYRRIGDHHRFVLERTGDKWKFLSGM